jgi:hypothetical protein
MMKEYVINKIKGTLPNTKQIPVLYADTEYEFFGSKTQAMTPVCRVIRTFGDEVIFDICSAQGVAVDAIYDIYPADLDIEDRQNTHLTREARIVQVKRFYSTARLTVTHQSQYGLLRLGISGRRLHCGPASSRVLML